MEIPCRKCGKPFDIHKPFLLWELSFGLKSPIPAIPIAFCPVCSTEIYDMILGNKQAVEKFLESL